MSKKHDGTPFGIYKGQQTVNAPPSGGRYTESEPDESVNDIIVKVEMKKFQNLINNRMQKKNNLVNMDPKRIYPLNKISDEIENNNKPKPEISNDFLPPAAIRLETQGPCAPTGDTSKINPFVFEVKKPKTSQKHYRHGVKSRDSSQGISRLQAGDPEFAVGPDRSLEENLREVQSNYGLRRTMLQIGNSQIRQSMDASLKFEMKDLMASS